MKKKCFTLSEVLFALILFLVGMTPLLGVLMATSKDNADNLHKIKANVFASQKLAELEASANSTSTSALSLRQSEAYPSIYYVIQEKSINKRGAELVVIMLGIVFNPQANLIPNLNSELSTWQKSRYKKGGHLCIGESHLASFNAYDGGFQELDYFDGGNSGNVILLDEVYTLVINAER